MVKIYLDGASLENIIEYKENDLVTGFTTNPTLMKAAGVDNYDDFIKEVIKHRRIAVKIECLFEVIISFSGLIKQMDASGGFSSKNLATSVSIMEDMLKDKGCIKFFSFPACIVATGLRGAIAQMIEKV
jgi:deoxyhypusine synthase